MRKKLSSLRFLSNRVWISVFLQLALAALFALCALLPRSAGRLIVLLGLLLQAALIVLAVFWIFRPYRRYAQSALLFAEGYTMTLEGISAELSPASELCMQRLQTEYSAAHLLKLSKRQAQYRALQNQINPHFLYNTLESIRSEALVAGLASVADMTEALAVFFRYTISKLENLVSVEEELQNCLTYFHIQQYRFGDRLQFQIDCDEEDREEIFRCRIPKLTLQPIFENSIIHGTELKMGAGKVTIKLERTENLLQITVSDDGVGMEEDVLAQLNDRLDKSGKAIREQPAEKGGVALTNVNNRIHLLYGEEYGLHAFSMPGVGTDVQITLPVVFSDRELLHHGGIS